MFSFLRTKNAKGRTIIVGLKSDNSSREMLLRVLTSYVRQGDNVLAVHVQELSDTFDPNTFHIHEDLCKSKQVDFQVRVCVGDSYIYELAHQVRVNIATVLAIGCTNSRPKDSIVSSYLKELPRTCSLLVVDNGGKVLIQKDGTSQRGSTCERFKPSPLYQSNVPYMLQKPSTVSAPASSSMQGNDKRASQNVKISIAREANISCRKFTSQEINSATHCFHPAIIISEGENSSVYRGGLYNGQAVAVKILKNKLRSPDDFFQEVELLCAIQHENIVPIIGYCYGGDINAIVYSLLKNSLNRNMRDLRWNERLGVAIGVAKALAFLHHSCDPPIIHRDVKSSNILLSDTFQPQLSDFGVAMIQREPQKNTKPFPVVGTFGYLAPEYIMYGHIDEKIDVYSYGVVLLELITGKEAIQTDKGSKSESLVLRTRSLLSCGRCEGLIDPYLSEDYNKDEMQTMIIAARLCLLHSSSRRPTMQAILKLFEDPTYWLRKEKERDEFLNRSSRKVETCQSRPDDSESTSGTQSMDEYLSHFVNSSMRI